MAIDTDACTSTQVDDRHMHVPIRCPSCSHSAAISTTTRTRTALSAPTSTGVRQCQRAPDRRADTHASIVNAQYDHNLPPYNNHLVVNQTRHTLISIFLIPLLSIFLNVCSATPIDNSLIDARITQECANVSSIDLVLIIDGSGSIGDSTFESELAFLSLLVSRFNISSDATRVAVVQFSDAPRLEVALGQYTTVGALQTAIQRIQYLGGTTHTGSALQFTLQTVFAGARGPNVPKVGVIITDGQAQDEVLSAAQALRTADVRMYAVGVTNLVDINQLYQITGTAARVFLVDAFDRLDEPLSRLIAREMCKYHFEPGIPEIVCEADGIGVRAQTRNPFEGNIFVSGHYNTDGCKRDASRFTNARQVELIVPFNQCDLDPLGVYVETTIIFMFHQWFMTKVDQAVKVQCFYMEADKTVSVPLEVSMITTEFRTAAYPMPTCTYTIHLNSPDGPLVTFAGLGQSVYHRWQCVESNTHFDTFGMLVHSCYVDDGNGEHIDVIDPHGCAVDHHIVGTPDYDTTLRLATKEVHVFKYADRPIVQFQCQISVCIKYDDGCKGITPPVCINASSPLALKERGKRHADSASATRSLDVVSQPMQVLDLVIGQSSAGAPCDTHCPSCLLSQPTSVGLLMALIVGYVLSLFVTAFLIYKNVKRKQ